MEGILAKFATAPTARAGSRFGIRNIRSERAAGVVREKRECWNALKTVAALLAAPGWHETRGKYYHPRPFRQVNGVRLARFANHSPPVQAY